jgi:hypothetical protein
MCCPKGKCGCQYFILLTLKKKIVDTGILDFLIKKLILDFYFCLKSDSGETPTGNFNDVFLSWTRIMSVLIG